MESETTIRSQTVYSGGRIQVLAETSRDGVVRFKVVYPRSAVVLAIDGDGKLLLVRQYRYALRRTLLEFPAGALEDDEDSFACAKRELREEAQVAGRDWIYLGVLYPVPGFCTELQYCYCATNLHHCQTACDPDEIIEIVRMSVPQFEQAVIDGLISDAKSIAAFSRARFMGLL